MGTSIIIGTGVTALQSGGASGPVAQTIAFGAATLAQAGGAQAVSGSTLVDFETVTPDTHWEIVGGRLRTKAGSTPASRHGEVLTCTAAGVTFPVTIDASAARTLYAASGAEIEAALAAVKATPSYGSEAWQIVVRPGTIAAAETVDANWNVPDPTGTTVATERDTIVLADALPRTSITGFAFDGDLTATDPDATCVDDLDASTTADLSGGHLVIRGERALSSSTPTILTSQIIVDGTGPISLRDLDVRFALPAPVWNRDDGGGAVLAGVTDLRPTITDHSNGPAPSADTGYFVSPQNECLSVGSTGGAAGPMLHLRNVRAGGAAGGQTDPRYYANGVSVLSAAKLVVEDFEAWGCESPTSLAFCPDVVMRRIRTRACTRTQVRIIPALYGSALSLAARRALTPWRYEIHDWLVGEVNQGGDLAGYHSNAVSIGGQSDASNTGADAPALHLLMGRMLFDLRVPAARYIPVDETVHGRQLNVFGWPLGSPIYSAARSSLGARLVPGAYNPGIAGEAAHILIISNSTTGVETTQGHLAMRNITVIQDFDHDDANGALRGDLVINGFAPSTGSETAAMHYAAHNILDQSAAMAGQSTLASNTFIDRATDGGGAQDYATVFAGPFGWDAVRGVRTASIPTTLDAMRAAVESVFAGAGGEDGYGGAVAGRDAAPAVSAYTPAIGATDHPVGSAFSLTFDRPIKLRAGDIRIVRVSDSAVIETIAVDGVRGIGLGAVAPCVSVAGTDLTILHSGLLVGGVEYRIEIDSGLVHNAFGPLAWAGPGVSWTFTAFEAAQPPMSLIEFDATNDYIQTNLAAAGPFDKVAIYYRGTIPSVSSQQIIHMGSNFFLWSNQANNIQLQIRNAGGTIIFNKNFATAVTDGLEHEIMFSVDWETGVGQIYVDGVSNYVAFGTAPIVGQSFAPTGTAWGLMATSAGAQKAAATVRRMAMWYGLAPDLSVAANREALADANNPIIGGITPILDAYGPLADWNSGDAQKGSATAWTVVGTLTEIL